MELQGSLGLNRFKQLPTTTCPNCMMVWLAPGLSQGDTYECKSCHLTFIVGDTRDEPSPVTFEDAATVAV